MNSPTNCLRCGVCCFSKLETYVRVSGDDWTRLGGAAERVAHFIEHRAYMKMGGGHCAALELRRQPDGSTEFCCTVYGQRPQVCRDLERGSPQCEAELMTKGERVGFPILFTTDNTADTDGSEPASHFKADGD